MTIDNLNPYQKEAVQDMSPACLVKANVGSGKTTVLVQKILYLYESKGISLEDMIVLTFTNKAANEIKERLGDKGSIYFGTFHSVALMLLKQRYADSLDGWTSDFTVVDPTEELELAQELISLHGLKIKYKNRLKKRLESEEKLYFGGIWKNPYQDDMGDLLEYLLDVKKKQNKMSFADLIRISTEKLKADNSAWPLWILVDEIQDSDKEQLEFLCALKKETTHFFGVGDPNQVIYSWRGGMETMFYQIKDRFHARELTLPLNYRSSEEILKAAGRFMQYGGKIESNHKSGNKIIVKNHYDSFQEAMYLAEEIKKKKTQNMSYCDIAVLYRKQEQADLLEKIFQQEGIPCHIGRRQTIKDIPVLDWLIHVLRYSCFPKDTYAGEAALMEPYYGEKRTRKFVKMFLADTKKGVSRLYDDMCAYVDLFQNRYVNNQDPVQITNVYQSWKQEWFQAFHLEECLHPTSASYVKDYKITEHLFHLIFYRCVDKKKSFLEATKDILEGASLYEVIFSEEDHREQDAVQLLTLHASKGLEFSCVYIIGVNQGCIPLPSKTPQGEEEERRLFFVGMTRARDNLELSYYTNPNMPGVMGGPGVFLQMLPKEILDWPEYRSQEEKRANLQKLRREVEERRKTEKPEEKNKVRVRHSKYGEGSVEEDDGQMITVVFDQYGKKQFMKAFSGLETL